MPKHENATYTGAIGDVFAHRFVLKTKDGNVLADLGPKGAERFPPRKGLKVRLEGEKKPSEIKVHAIGPEDGDMIEIDHPKKDKHHPHHHDEHHDFVDPSVALRAADKHGYEVRGEPVRKPKHFEVRAVDKKGHEVELHIELDGHIRKEKPIARA